MPVPTTTATVTGRDSIDGPDDDDQRHAFTPSPDWKAEYTKQATPTLIARLCNYARTRAIAVGAAGRKVDSYYPRELVMDALGDTWLGKVRWDPAKCSLAHHIVRTIEGRADKHRKHAIDHPHDVLGDPHEGSRRAERDASEQAAGKADAFTRVYATEVLAEVRQAAGKDKHVLRLIAAYVAGCETREAVLAEAKMTVRTYQRAYARLRRLVRKLADGRLVEGRAATGISRSVANSCRPERERFYMPLVSLDQMRVRRAGFARREESREVSDAPRTAA